MNGISFIILLHLILFVKFNGTNAKNTLLIFADDAGLELGCLGHPVIKTPLTDKYIRYQQLCDFFVPGNRRNRCFYYLTLQNFGAQFTVLLEIYSFKIVDECPG